MSPVFSFGRRGLFGTRSDRPASRRRGRRAEPQLRAEALESRALLAAVNIVSSPNADMAYKAGSQIAIQLEFDAAVNVSGQPLLLMNSGGRAIYAGTSGNGTVVNFLYTVGAGESAPDLDVQSASGSLINGTITDSIGGATSSRVLPVGPSTTSLAYLKNISIDTTAPAVPTVTPLRVNPTVIETNPNFFLLHPNYFTLSGTAGTTALAAGEVLSVTVNGCTYTPTVAANGSWSVNLLTDSFTGGVINPWSATNIDAYEVVAVVRDAAGNTSTDQTRNELTIDMTAPTAVSVTSSNPDGSYGIGDVINVNVVFNEPVTVTGTPRIQLNAAANRFAVYSTTNSNVVTFTYTVLAGDSTSDLDYASPAPPNVSAIILNGGSIHDPAGNAAGLALPAPGATTAGTLAFNKNIVIDTVAPQLTLINGITPNGYYGPGADVLIDVVFDSPVLVTGSPLLDLNAGPTATASYVAPTDPTVPQTTLRFRYTVAQGDTTRAGFPTDLRLRSSNALRLNGGSIQDIAGNDAVLTSPNLRFAATGGGSSDIRIVSAPVVAAVTAETTDGTYTAGDVIDIIVRFDRPVTLVETPVSAPAIPILPTIRLNASVNNSFGVYDNSAAGGSGTNQLRFRYTVRAGDTTSGDLDYATTSALQAGGYMFLDSEAYSATTGATNVPAVLTLPATGSSSVGSLDYYKNIRIALDTTNPLTPSLGLGAGVASGATFAESTQASGVVTVAGELNATYTVTFIGGSSTIVKTGTLSAANVMQGVQLSASDVIALGTGSVSVTARQTDPSGNVSPTTAALTYTRAIVAPQITLGSGVANGATNAEAIQASGVVLVRGESGNAIDVSFSRAGVTVTKTVTGAGATSVAVVLSQSEVDTLGDGLITVSATQTDPAFMVSSAATTTFTLDRVAPLPVVLALGTGVANGANLAEATQPSGVVTVIGELSATITLVFTGSAVGSTPVTKTVTGTGVSQAVELSNAEATALRDGTITVTATQSDAAGNPSSSAIISFALDTSAPAAPVLALGTGVANGATLAEFTQPSGVVTVTGELNAAITVTFTGVNGSVSKPLTGTGAAQAVVMLAADATTLGNGLVVVTASQTDAAGNTSTSSSTVQFTLDTSAPTVANVTSSNNNGTYLPGDVITIQVELSDVVNVAAGTTASLALNAGRSATFSSSGAVSLSVLTFTYVVQAGDASSDLDYTSTNALTITSGSISDTAGNSLVTTLPAPPTGGGIMTIMANRSLGQNKDIRIAGSIVITSPVVIGSTNSGTAPGYRAAVTSIPITFNMAVSGFSLANVRLFLNNRPISLARASVTGSGANWVVRLPALATNLRGLYRLDIVGAGITAGNGATMTGTTSIFWRRV